MRWHAIAIASAPGWSQLRHRAAEKKYGPGASDTEIKLGQTSPFSGPASAYSVIAKTQAAYFKMINEQGGINGRRIKLLSLDYGYSPPKTVEQTRKLVEEEGVAVSSISSGPRPAPSAKISERQEGAAPLRRRRCHLFGDREASRGGWACSVILAEGGLRGYVLENKPDAKIGIFYQNDDPARPRQRLQGGVGPGYGPADGRGSTYESPIPRSTARSCN